MMVVPLDQRGARRFPVLGRLKAGVALSAAQAEMDEICRRLAVQFPTTNLGDQAGVLF